MITRRAISEFDLHIGKVPSLVTARITSANRVVGAFHPNNLNGAG
jgi:hypothetical protein